VALVHNGTDRVRSAGGGKSPTPMVAVVGRLVPHKRVEHAIDAVLALREAYPDLTLQVVGSGWWEARLHDYARARGAGDAVVFRGHLDEAAKHEVYERAWLLALPSLKEGWGLVVGEAGMHGTPTVAYREAGGTQESVVDGFSGVLVEDRDGLVAAVGELLGDEERRGRLSRGARVTSHAFTWEHAQGSFAAVVRAALEGRRVDDLDPAEDRGPARES
jgi:glycosyltransferase involved in cell wall biosynthesis